MLDEELIERICGKIEAAFEALSETEAAEEPQPEGELYHYTSAQGLLGIIESGQIWATNSQYLNDKSELSNALDIFRAQLFSTPLKLLDNATTFAQSISAYSETLPLDHFVVSFCERGDLLGQWRGYGSQGTGFSIGFFFATFGFAAGQEANKHRGGCTLRRVKYRKEEKTELIRKRLAIIREVLEPHAEALEPHADREFSQLVRLWNQIAASLHPTLALMKHESFEDEQEWRFVRTLWKPSVPTEEWPVKIRLLGNGLAPYLPIPWPLPGKSVLDGKRGIRFIVCGPSASPQLKEKVARDLLIANQCWNVEVSSSKVPLRA